MYTVSQMYAAELITGNKNDAGNLHADFCAFLNEFDYMRKGDCTNMPELDVLASLIVIWQMQTGKKAICL